MRPAIFSSRFPWKLLVLAALPAVLMGAAPTAPSVAHFAWAPFGFLVEPQYGLLEKVGLLICLVISFVGLGYAFRLRKEVLAADAGTPAMKPVAGSRVVPSMKNT